MSSSPNPRLTESQGPENSGIRYAPTLERWRDFVPTLPDLLGYILLFLVLWVCYTGGRKLWGVLGNSPKLIASHSEVLRSTPSVEATNRSIQAALGAGRETAGDLVTPEAKESSATLSSYARMKALLQSWFERMKQSSKQRRGTKGKQRGQTKPRTAPNSGIERF